MGLQSEPPPHCEVIETLRDNQSLLVLCRVWTTPSPRGDWNLLYLMYAYLAFVSSLNHPLTARWLTPIPDILKRYRGFFYAKNLKNWLVRVYIVKGKVPEKISEKSFRKNLKNLLVRVYIVKGDDHMIKNFCDVPMFRWFSDIHSSRGYSHEQIFSVLCSGVPLWHVARLSLFPVCRRAWLLLWLLQIKLKKPDIPGIDSERWWSPCRYLL